VPGVYFTGTNTEQTGEPTVIICPVGFNFPLSVLIEKTTTESDPWFSASNQ
jgi:hypothetical protein